MKTQYTNNKQINIFKICLSGLEDGLVSSGGGTRGTPHHGRSGTIRSVPSRLGRTLLAAKAIWLESGTESDQSPGQRGRRFVPTWQKRLEAGGQEFEIPAHTLRVIWL